LRSQFGNLFAALTHITGYLRGCSRQQKGSRMRRIFPHFQRSSRRYPGKAARARETHHASGSIKKLASPRYVRRRGSPTIKQPTHSSWAARLYQPSNLSFRDPDYAHSHPARLHRQLIPSPAKPPLRLADHLRASRPHAAPRHRLGRRQSPASFAGGRQPTPLRRRPSSSISRVV